MEPKGNRGDNFEKIILRGIIEGVIPRGVELVAEVIHENRCPFHLSNGVDVCTCQPDIILTDPMTGNVYTFGDSEKMLELMAKRGAVPMKKGKREICWN